MKQFALVLTCILALSVCAFAQNYHPPRAGEIISYQNDIGPIVRPGSAMDWPWLGSMSIAVTYPTGLTFDGQYFWVSNWGGTIYKIDLSGTVVGSIPSPALWPGGCVYDGANIWVTDYVGGPQIFKLDMTTGAILASYQIVYSYYWAGMAWDGQYLYHGINTGGPGAHTIYKIDPTTGATVGTIPVPSQDISGLTYHDGHLWYSDSETYMLYKIDMSGVIVDSSPSYVNSWLGGVTFEGGNLWNVDYTNSMMHEYDLTTNPNFTVTLTYNYGSPVPAGGGAINFDVWLENNETFPVNFDLWIEIPPQVTPPSVPNRNLTFPGGFIIMRPDMNWPIPASWPAGNYTMDWYIGDMSTWTAWASDSFPFEKSATDDGSGFTLWEIDGDPLDQLFEGIDFGATVVSEFALLGSYPNPFNPSATISYTLDNSDLVKLSVYDLSGRQVATLVDGYRDAGAHEVNFDASGLASGVYVYRLSSGQQVASGKMVLMK